MIMDMKRFRRELSTAARASFDAMKHNSHAEHFYAFALITSALFGYVFPYANTEEGIHQGSKWEAENVRGFYGRLDMATKACRWEPVITWRFTRKHFEMFDKVNRILADVNMEEALCQLPKEELQTATDEIENALIEVLRQLRADGCFGDDRSFYLNISRQDQTYDDFYRTALQLNTPEVCERLRQDLSDVAALWDSLPTELK